MMMIFQIRYWSIPGASESDTPEDVPEMCPVKLRACTTATRPGVEDPSIVVKRPAWWSDSSSNERYFDGRVQRSSFPLLQIVFHDSRAPEVFVSSDRIHRLADGDACSVGGLELFPRLDEGFERRRRINGVAGEL